MADFFKKAFGDMKESAKAQHEVDKANFEAAKAESRAQWEEAKAMGKPEKRKEIVGSRAGGRRLCGAALFQSKFKNVNKILTFIWYNV